MVADLPLVFSAVNDLALAQPLKPVKNQSVRDCKCRRCLCLCSGLGKSNETSFCSSLLENRAIGTQAGLIPRSSLKPSGVLCFD